MMRITHAKGYTADASPFTIDLRDIGTPSESLLVFEACDIDIEVLGNSAAVTLTANGPFTNSAELDVADGSFAIDGAKKLMEGFAIGSLTFTSASVPFNVNIVRRTFTD